MTGCGLFRQQALITASALWIYPLAMLTTWALADLTVTRAMLAWAATFGTASAGFYAVLLSRLDRTPGLGAAPGVVPLRLAGLDRSLARFLNFRLDQLFVVFIASEATLGIYASAVNISELLLYLPAATGWVLVPFIARDDAPSGPAKRCTSSAEFCC